MLFNSAVFITRFLPVALIGFFILGALEQRRLAITWLTLTSLFFYGWWNVSYVPLLLGSMLFNYTVGHFLGRQPRKWLLVLGVAANLALLGVYKYTGFILSTVNSVFDSRLLIPDIALPLAISFFTFQQIAYLSDTYDGVAKEPGFANYCMFITFFPHLIAGPITHHKEMLPQFDEPRIFRPQANCLTLGLTVFVIGLMKKVIFADSISAWVGPVFNGAAVHDPVTLLEAWGGAIAYTLQIYFDFSGYSDMAIGLGLLFGIRLPLNFDSPYKSRNIIEFWSRWHMTLTRFLTAYIYNPIVLPLNRARIQAGKPVLRRGKTTLGAFAVLVALPTLWTMFLAGLWHGAGWQFVVFGTVHGLYLVINQGWRAVKARLGWPADSRNQLVHAVAVLFTFACVVVTMVIFRARDLPSGLSLLADMAGAHGLVVPYFFEALRGVHTASRLLHLRLGVSNLLTGNETIFILVLLAITWLLPNTQQWMRSYETGIGATRGATWLEQKLPTSASLLVWRPTIGFGVLVGCLGFIALTRAVSAAPSEFLYFKF